MHLDFALPVDGDLEAGIQRHDKKAELAVMDYSYHVPITEWTETVGHLLLLFLPYLLYASCITVMHMHYSLHGIHYLIWPKADSISHGALFVRLSLNHQGDVHEALHHRYRLKPSSS